MKQAAFALIVTAAFIASVFSFGGCSSQQDTPDTSDAVSDSSVTPAETLVGQWKCESLTDHIYTFNADGTGQYDMAGNVLKLSYTVEKDDLTITFLAEGYVPVTLKYELKDGKLNIKDSFGNDTFYERISD